MRRSLEKLGSGGKRALEQIDSASTKAQPTLRRLVAGLGTPIEQATAGSERSRDLLAVLDHQIANA